MNQYISPRNKLFSHLDRLALIQQGKTPPPVNIEIDLSNRCSLGFEVVSLRLYSYTGTAGQQAQGKEPRRRSYG